MIQFDTFDITPDTTPKDVNAWISGKKVTFLFIMEVNPHLRRLWVAENSVENAVAKAGLN